MTSISTVEQLKRELRKERERTGRLLRVVAARDEQIKGLVEKNKQLRDTLDEIATMARKK